MWSWGVLGKWWLLGMVIGGWGCAASTLATRADRERLAAATPPVDTLVQHTPGAADPFAGCDEAEQVSERPTLIRTCGNDACYVMVLPVQVATQREMVKWAFGRMDPSLAGSGGGERSQVEEIAVPGGRGWYRGVAMAGMGDADISMLGSVIADPELEQDGWSPIFACLYFSVRERATKKFLHAAAHVHDHGLAASFAADLKALVADVKWE